MGYRSAVQRGAALAAATGAGVVVMLGGLSLPGSAGAADIQPAVANASPAVRSSAGQAVVSELATPAYGNVLVVGGSGPLAGAPLYMITSDAAGRYGCTTALAQTFQGPITCTGPESDLFNNVQTDEWPAFTTTGEPVAGPGVHDGLLATVNRPGIGRQVTYGGHPLYLFDPPSTPFRPFGEGFLETVAPLPPWHGLWDLVDARYGNPAMGTAAVGTETLPGGRTAVSVEEYNNAVPGGVAVTAYAFSRDGESTSRCTGSCSVTWIPVLTTGRPQFSGGLDGDDLGMVRLPDGADQVTYHDKPLYVYSGEEAVFPTAGGPPQATGTVGNGNGVRGPEGGTFSVLTPH